MIGSRFRRTDRLGGDRTGEVWEATDDQTGQPCVVKLVDPLVFSSPTLMQRALRELKKLEEIDSPNIVKVLGHGHEGDGDEGQLWVAMEKVPQAQSLVRAVASYGAMPPARASATVVAIARGLGEAARVGVMHRDLSPKNVLIDAHGAVKLINFCFPVPGDIPGEPEFLAPELVEGKPVDQRTNIYSLGAVFYYLLTAQPPFAGEPAQVRKAHLAGGPQPPSQLAAVPPQVEALVLKALERQSSRRFMTLRQLMTEVERTGGGDDAGGTQPMGAAGKAPPASTMPGFGSSDAAAGASGAEVGGKGKRRVMSKTMIGGFAALDTPVPPGPAAAPRAQKTEAQPATPATVDDGATRRMPTPVPEPEPPRGAATNLAPPEPQAPPQQHQAPAPQQHQAPAPQQHQAPAPQQHQAPAPQQPAQPPFPQAHAQPQPEPQQLTQPEPPRAPVVSQPMASQSAAGGKNKAARPPAAKSKKKPAFRETMWFKKGDLDAVAAEEAAAAAQQGKVVADKADEIPMEDRYSDDGSLSSGDQNRYSLKTGHTQHIPAVQDPVRPADVSEDELIDEMKRGRGPIIAAVIGGLAVLIAIIVWYVSSGGDDEAPESQPPAATQPGGAGAPAPTPGSGS